MADGLNYELKTNPAKRAMAVPDLDYQPCKPKEFRPKIALIGCGGITLRHLEAWTRDGYEIVALCDLAEDKARERRKQFAPEARIYTDYRELLEKEDGVNVVDVALHPGPRAEVIEAALKAGRHVLSQKPFVLDLALGERLVQIADDNKVRLAVNQNGRWAPYARWIYQAIRAGLIGETQTVSIHINWDHSWVKGTDFERIHHLVLYDFAVHWIDMTTLLFEGREARQCFGAMASSNVQTVKPPMLVGATIQFSGGIASLSFDAYSLAGSEESFSVTGSRGTVKARGDVCGANDITLFTPEGFCKPQVEGKWFNDGFRGAMGELMCAIEEGREPANSGRNNLRTLEIVFAVLESADTGRVVRPGEARELGDTCKII